MNLLIERARIFIAKTTTTIKLRVGRVPVLVWVIAVLLVIGPVLIWLGYTQDWIGLRAYTDPKGDYHPAKTLWDWMELLIIPIVLAVGGFLFSQAGRKAGREAADQRAETERKIADDRTRETTLQNYLDKMAELLLVKNLPDPEAPPLIRDTARAQMVTTLRQLDATRRNLLFGFLRQADLIGGDDPVRILAGANLSGADLSGADLSKADLSRSILSGANLSRATLNRASLMQADLRKADLNGADLCGAELSMAKLRGADLSGANLSRACVPLLKPGSENSKRGSLAFAADLSGADLSLATLRGADLSGADLNWADLSEADLSGASLRDADLRGANLRGATLSGADLSEANLKGTVIDATTRIDGKWHLVWEIVNQPQEGRDLPGKDLSGADLSEANLSRANLSEADLGGANLRGATLCSAVLSRAALSGANLTDARYNDATQWPEGFIPPPLAVKVEPVSVKQP